MSWLRWVNLGVALLAAGLAHLAAWLYTEFDPRTAWGPWAYGVGAYLTSALALGAWWNSARASWLLWLGALGHAAWCAYMFNTGFIPIIAGHALAAVFFAVTAWSIGRAPAMPPGT